MILRRCGPRKPTEQGHRRSDVLACPGEVWEGFIILDDPPVHVAGYGACAMARNVNRRIITDDEALPHFAWASQNIVVAAALFCGLLRPMTPEDHQAHHEI